jgi:hypothetical protein
MASLDTAYYARCITTLNQALMNLSVQASDITSHEKNT